MVAKEPIKAKFDKQSETPAAEQSSTASSERRAWICQYRPGDHVSRWTDRATPNSTIWWKTGKPSLPSDMRPGDPVVYWRSVGGKGRGGIVGTGWVQSTDLVPDEHGANRFPTVVQEFFDSDPIPRDEVIDRAGIKRRSWQGAVLELDHEVAPRIDELLREHGMLALPTVADNIGDTIPIRDDDPETEHDSLGRSALAVSFACKLHRIWCRMQGVNSPPSRALPRDSAGFVAHVDAPWGPPLSDYLSPVR